MNKEKLGSQLIDKIIKNYKKYDWKRYQDWLYFDMSIPCEGYKIKEYMIHITHYSIWINFNSGGFEICGNEEQKEKLKEVFDDIETTIETNIIELLLNNI